MPYEYHQISHKKLLHNAKEIFTKSIIILKTAAQTKGKIKQEGINLGRIGIQHGGIVAAANID